MRANNIIIRDFYKNVQKSSVVDDYGTRVSTKMRGKLIHYIVLVRHCAHFYNGYSFTCVDVICILYP